MYIIVLSNQGDLMDRTSQWGFRATFNRDLATKFVSYEDAKDTMRSLSIKFMWGDARVERIA